MKSSFLLLSLLVVASTLAAQFDRYRYQRPLSGVKGQWHVVEVPDEIFSRTKPGLSDLRIYGITAGNDTIEAPYLLKVSKDQVVREQASVQLINQSKTARGYFYSLEVAHDQMVNRIDLDFERQNFDWKIRLEGSNDQKAWFTLLDEYRILSIQNEETRYAFLRLSFPDSKYQFYRLFVPTSKSPDLIAAKVTHVEEVPGNHRKYELSKLSSEQESSTKRSVVELSLSDPVSISSVSINIQADYDYYRPVSVSYLTDSFETEMGWKYRYRKLTIGVLNSLEDNTFAFPETVVKRIRLIVYNQDNAPLTIGTVTAKGGVHEVITRITDPATYYLVYGNENARTPKYDLVNFQDQIPEDLAKLSVGNERVMKFREDAGQQPLFGRKIYLWLIMGLIIMMLGWFAVSMIRKSQLGLIKED